MAYTTGFARNVHIMKTGSQIGDCWRCLPDHLEGEGMRAVGNKD